MLCYKMAMSSPSERDTLPDDPAALKALIIEQPLDDVRLAEGGGEAGASAFSADGRVDPPVKADSHRRHAAASAGERPRTDEDRAAVGVRR